MKEYQLELQAIRWLLNYYNNQVIIHQVSVGCLPRSMLLLIDQYEYVMKSEYSFFIGKQAYIPKMGFSQLLRPLSWQKFPWNFSYLLWSYLGDAKIVNSLKYYFQNLIYKFLCIYKFLIESKDVNTSLAISFFVNLHNPNMVRGVLRKKQNTI